MQHNSASGTSTPYTISPSSTVISTPPKSPDDYVTYRLPSESASPDYATWRPSFHVMPSSGWMNDPCAPGYDPKTGTYFVSFQWNPKGPDWGDICWGTATSRDMVNWTVLEQPTLSPDTPYDHKGVFTGCLLPPADESLTIAYTSVSHLPIHYTVPRVKGCESLSLAKSYDSGKTWTKIKSNPILPTEPECLDITGWRDPFVATWPSMAQMLDLDHARPFALVSGGIRHITPTTFLYVLDSDDVTAWKYIGPLTNVGLNKRLSRWSGDLGRNWEVSNFMTLTDETQPSQTRQFLVMGTEGCLPADLSPSSTAAAAPGPERPARGQLWMSGSLRTKTSLPKSPRLPSCDILCSTEMTYDFGGHLDHGCLYAANSFFDPQSQKQVVWGWIPEDDLCDELRQKQGWSGMLSLPRELRIQTLRHVVSASACQLEDITSVELEADTHGSFTLRTLASEPVKRVVDGLRRGKAVRRTDLEQQRLVSGGYEAAFTPYGIRTDQWELACSFRVSKGCYSVGLKVGHSADFSRSTSLTFFPHLETFTVTRPSFPSPKSAELINSSPEVAPHTLFTMRDPASGAAEEETLDIRAWRDNSVLEVFINGRTAISTRIYAAEETFGIRFFADESLTERGTEIGTELVFATLWDGIGVA
ncbi:putative beta-Fructufuranosidase [Vermiconidia calcicola]|uniref:Beta-Fructufuranosidase n=1 Tax=Vermiconidia calcicola TaxID=1690605 RepID=A0ACC3MCK6_9PEZI|nr:putative beta-Fructufuranosidase [Vermiconidia calcicola]